MGFGSLGAQYKGSIQHYKICGKLRIGKCIGEVWLVDWKVRR